MKKSYIYIALVSCIALLSGCMNMEELAEPAQKFSKTFHAMIEGQPSTKTVLGEKGEDGIRPVLWMPEDKIGIVPSSGGTCDVFVNKNTETSEIATFEGQTSLASSYLAVYPYDKDATVADGSIHITLGHEQTYKAGSFEQGAFPMIARSSDTDSDGLMFYNLCGVLQINITGEEKISAIGFSSQNKVSGRFTVPADYKSFPELVADASASTSVTLNCGEGIQLSTDTPTPFYLVLPPGEYETFTLTVHTADGKMMFKQGKNPLNIKRSYVTAAGSLAYAESTVIDLSLHGTANCYIVPAMGLYSFNASVIGNGIYGIIPGASFHTEDPAISPASVEVLWETDKSNEKVNNGTLLKNIMLTPEGNVTFMSTGTEGNALVAVKGEKGSILWSWHIWFTDPPKDHIYENSYGRFNVLDRNLGATRADHGTGDEWKESIGTIYQWGRKDPFLKSTYSLLRSADGGKGPFSIYSAIQNPTTAGVMNGGAYNHPSWVDVKNSKFWTSASKTIYDPCPAGYRVPEMDIWRGFTANGKNTSYLESISASDVHTHGFNFIYDGSNTTWYPATPMLDWNGGYSEPNKTGRLWTTTPERSFKYETTPNITFDSGDCWENYAIGVRCVTDEGHVDTALPMLEIIGARNITTESASIVYNITSDGGSEITESGIIYSTSSGVSAENGIKVSAAGADCIVEITGLTEGTKYYAIAYATNAYGTTYSKEAAFYTEFANTINLSKYGTSNCYMVSAAGAYTFDASVKGNSLESIGNPIAAKVVWETRNTDASVAVGDIIYDLEYSYGYVRFKATGNPGNALIAVVDANDTIIWSWHIWVTDYDPNLNFCTYLSGAVMMDRNLGALNAGSDAASYGFLYEWGRKDPLIGSANGSTTFATTAPSDLKQYVTPDSPFEYSFANPTHAVGNLINDDSAWSRTKTKYDPCPVGWRVPNGGPDGVWSGMIYGSPGIVKSGGSWTINPPYSDPATIYPAPGYTGGTQLTLSFPGSALYCWSCDVTNNGGGYGMHLFNRIERELASNKSAEFSVRCMREHDVNIVLNTGSATEVTKTSAVIHGSMGYLGTVNLLELGFVWSSTNSTPEIINDSKTTVDVREGEFSRSLTNLSPGTTYYVRTFATEGNITIYGPATHFTTQVAAGNEDIPEDDEYDW